MRKTPIDIIRDLRSKGLSDNQITQSLQKDGFQMADIADAFNLAEHQQYPIGDHMDPMNPMSMEPQSIAQQPQFGAPDMMGGADDSDEIEQLIEQVIEEKWTQLQNKILELENWKQQVEEKVNKLDQSMIDLKRSQESLQQAIVGKVGEYDKNVLEVGSQLEAMEKAFSQVLPTFTKNINELNRITQELQDRN